MKHTHVFILSFASVLIVFALLKTFRTINQIPINYNEKLQQNATNSTISVSNTRDRNIRIPSLEERRTMSHSARIALFERLGYVPKGAEINEFVFAERTSWWGKRLDPKEFWTNRVVWLDESADFSARSRGRAYPPMPYEDPSISNRSDIDEGGKGGYASLDGGRQPGFVLSDREMIFWHNFAKTHPRPPERIQSWLNERTDMRLRTKVQIEDNIKTGKSVVSLKRFLEDGLEVDLRDAKKFWFPTECITIDAYEWEHVMRKRAEYDELVASGKSNDERENKWFFDRVLVDRELITEPLTEEQIDAANAWKVAYLNRLRTEKWDESYIKAYLESWNLTEEYVFGKKTEDKNK